MTRLAYDIDLTNAQWELSKPHIPTAKAGGRPRSLDMRQVLNAIFYLLSKGLYAWSRTF
jgi:putative transposase